MSDNYHKVLVVPAKAGTQCLSTETEGTATAGAPTFSGDDVVVRLTGVSDAQNVTFSLTNVASAVIGGSGSLRLGILWGDVNQSRAVSIADLSLVNAQLAQLVTVANFLKDVNSSGSFTVADKGLANANLPQALPAPWLGVQPDASQENGPRKRGLTGDIHGRGFSEVGKLTCNLETPQ